MDVNPLNKGRKTSLIPSSLGENAFGVTNKYPFVTFITCVD